ncbi:MAG: hypothetical protein IJM97_02915 [Clostridia bacterium]|nr:hypothetical protein [Clostridia bacterium]MBQ6707881.1 hypothetical protein [Clostridia bacterium]
MKKRSLVSAIAMLVVSAIVLTSATFAWFATGDTATVNQISASVSNAEGSILISADGNEWKTVLTTADLTAVTTNTLASTLSPVSVTPGTQGIGSIVSGAIEEGVFTATEAAGKYVQFSVLVKSDVNCTVDVAPVFTHTQAYVFAGLTVNGTFTVAGTGSYLPYTGAAGDTANDTNGNAILDGDETTALGAQVDGVSSLNTSIDLVAGEATQLTFYMWAEGQHADCKGQTADTATLAINFTKQAATAEG